MSMSTASFCKPSVLFQTNARPRKSSARQGRAHVSARGSCQIFAFKNFGDGLLDYMEAGPKLRKWYGEGDRKPGEKKKRGPDRDDDVPKDSILVTDADSPIGELVLLQLILARLKVAALVKNPSATMHAYGSYVTPIQGSVDDQQSLSKALRNSKAAICTSRLGALPQLLENEQLDHLVLLSSVGLEGLSIFDKLLGGEQTILTDDRREAALDQCSSPLTVVRVGKLVDSPGGSSEIQIVQGPAVPSGSIGREDVAQTLVRALQRRPKGTLRVAVQSKPIASPFKDWDRLFANVDEAM